MSAPTQSSTFAELATRRRKHPNLGQKLFKGHPNAVGLNQPVFNSIRIRRSGSPVLVENDHLIPSRKIYMFQTGLRRPGPLQNLPAVVGAYFRPSTDW